MPLSKRLEETSIPSAGRQGPQPYSAGRQGEDPLSYSGYRLEEMLARLHPRSEGGEPGAAEDSRQYGGSPQS